MKNNRLDVPFSAPGFQNDIEFNKMVHSRSRLPDGSIINVWVDQFRKRYAEWRNATDKSIFGYDFVMNFFKFKFLNIQGTTLLSTINDCNKAAFVLPSSGAEVYARLLTPSRGNAGKEVYFQQYLTFNMRGVVMPHLLSRLSRIKESGIVEWLTNVTECISLLQSHDTATTAAFHSYEHPAGASIGGNIIVIFTVLVGGLGVALVGFMFEIIFGCILEVRLFLKLKLLRSF